MRFQKICVLRQHVIPPHRWYKHVCDISLAHMWFKHIWTVLNLPNFVVYFWAIVLLRSSDASCEIFKNVTWVASREKHFQEGFGGFFGSWTSFRGVLVHKKEVFEYTRLHPLFVNGVVTVSSHANKDKFGNCDIHVTCVDVRWFLCTISELNWGCAICVLWGLI